MAIRMGTWSSRPVDRGHRLDLMAAVSPSVSLGRRRAECLYRRAGHRLRWKQCSDCSSSSPSSRSSACLGFGPVIGSAPSTTTSSESIGILQLACRRPGERPQAGAFLRQVSTAVAPCGVPFGIAVSERRPVGFRSGVGVQDALEELNQRRGTAFSPGPQGLDPDANTVATRAVPGTLPRAGAICGGLGGDRNRYCKIGPPCLGLR